MFSSTDRPKIENEYKRQLTIQHWRHLTILQLKSTGRVYRDQWKQMKPFNDYPEMWQRNLKCFYLYTFSDWWHRETSSIWVLNVFLFSSRKNFLFKFLIFFFNSFGFSF